MAAAAACAQAGRVAGRPRRGPRGLTAALPPAQAAGAARNRPSRGACVGQTASDHGCPQLAGAAMDAALDAAVLLRVEDGLAACSDAAVAT